MRGDSYFTLLEGREDVFRRIEDVALEQLQRMARELMCDPGEDPLVQLRIAVIVARQSAWLGDERPGVDHCEQRENQRGDRPVGAEDPACRRAAR